MVKVAASIVLYKNDPQPLESLLISIIRAKPDIQIYLIDNSPTRELSHLARLNEEVITYIPNPSNPGFGAAHNRAMEISKMHGAAYHFVINPDVSLSSDVFTPMIDFMERNPDVGMMMPQVLNEDSTVQNLPKLLPSPLSVLKRKFKGSKKHYEKFITRYELRDVDKKKIYNAPVLSGCFTLFRVSAMEEVGMYDDKFFMYFEDWDLSRRMHEKYRTIYYPLVSIVHGYESGANKSLRLFWIYLNSAYHYFNKWGWVYDSKRGEINRKTLRQFK